jgi:hypothetical protein
MAAHGPAALATVASAQLADRLALTDEQIELARPILVSLARAAADDARTLALRSLESQGQAAHDRAKALRQQADDSELAAHGFDVAASFLRRTTPVEGG